RHPHAPGFLLDLLPCDSAHGSLRGRHLVGENRGTQGGRATCGRGGGGETRRIGAPRCAADFWGASSMHHIRWVREHPEQCDCALPRRGLPGAARELVALDEARRAAIQRSEAAQARRNAASKEIGEAKKTKDEARAQALLAEVAEFRTTIPELE